MFARLRTSDGPEVNFYTSAAADPNADTAIFTSSDADADVDIETVHFKITSFMIILMILVNCKLK